MFSSLRNRYLDGLQTRRVCYCSEPKEAQRWVESCLDERFSRKLQQSACSEQALPLVAVLPRTRGSEALSGKLFDEQFSRKPQAAIRACSEQALHYWCICACMYSTTVSLFALLTSNVPLSLRGTLTTSGSSGNAISLSAMSPHCCVPQCTSSHRKKSDKLFTVSP